jgi:hypothetical protein
VSLIASADLFHAGEQRGFGEGCSEQNDDADFEAALR